MSSYAETRRLRRRTALAAFLAMPFALQAQTVASDWPTRPVTWVNPFAAGSAVDVVGRIIAQKVAANTGQAMNVDNKTGASGKLRSCMRCSAASSLSCVTRCTYLMGASLGSMASSASASSCSADNNNS